jgi:hypothetical protein
MDELVKRAMRLAGYRGNFDEMPQGMADGGAATESGFFQRLQDKWFENENKNLAGFSEAAMPALDAWPERVPSYQSPPEDIEGRSFKDGLMELGTMYQGLAQEPIRYTDFETYDRRMLPEANIRIPQVREYADGGAAGTQSGRTRFGYETDLTPEQEMSFQAWKQQHAPDDSGYDYDLRGAFAAGESPVNGHFDDRWKKPNHPTFSDFSIYATGDNAAKAGHWEGDTFVPPGYDQGGAVIPGTALDFDLHDESGRSYALRNGEDVTDEIINSARRSPGSPNFDPTAYAYGGNWDFNPRPVRWAAQATNFPEWQREYPLATAPVVLGGLVAGMPELMLEAGQHKRKELEDSAAAPALSGILDMMQGQRSVAEGAEAYQNEAPDNNWDRAKGFVGDAVMAPYALVTAIPEVISNWYNTNERAKTEQYQGEGESYDDYVRREDQLAYDLNMSNFDLASLAPLGAVGARAAGMADTGDVGMFAGKRAAENYAKQGRYGPRQALNMAETLEKAGLSTDEAAAIATKTLGEIDPALGGVSKSVYGQWEFEIDDSPAVWESVRPKESEYRLGIAKQLADRYGTNDFIKITETYPDDPMVQEYLGLIHKGIQRDKSYTYSSPMPETPDVLSDFYSHPDLYTGYPELAGVSAYESNLGTGVQGAVTMDGRKLYLNTSRDTLPADRIPYVAGHETMHLADGLEGNKPGQNQEGAARQRPFRFIALRNEAMKAFERGEMPSFYTHQLSDDARARIMALPPEEAADAIAKDYLYRTDASEVRARNVENRLKMTPEERRATPPERTEDVPRDRQLFANSEDAAIPGALMAAERSSPEGWDSVGTMLPEDVPYSQPPKQGEKRPDFGYFTDDPLNNAFPGHERPVFDPESPSTGTPGMVWPFDLAERATQRSGDVRGFPDLWANKEEGALPGTILASLRDQAYAKGLDWFAPTDSMPTTFGPNISFPLALGMRDYFADAVGAFKSDPNLAPEQWRNNATQNAGANIYSMDDVVKHGDALGKLYYGSKYEDLTPAQRVDIDEELADLYARSPDKTLALEDNDRSPAATNDYDKAAMEQAWRKKIRSTGELFANTEDAAIPGVVLAGERAGAADSAIGAGTETGGLSGPGGIPGSEGGVATPSRTNDPYAPIPGIPRSTKIPGYGDVETRPIPWAVDSANSYLKRFGQEHLLPEEFAKFDPEMAAKYAQAFEEMKHDPSNPAVRRAFEALVEETGAQYRALKDAGAEFRFNKPGEDPYAASPAMGYPEFRDQRTLSVFPTLEGYGSAESGLIDNNPLLMQSGEKFGEHPATYNDLFRAVHDAYGHYTFGNPFFRHAGEDRAYILHSGMYGDDAVKAAASELRGQNSWLNFGPYGEQNRTATAADTVYAPQKTGIMPDWAVEHGTGRANRFKLGANDEDAAIPGTVLSSADDMGFDLPEAPKSPAVRTDPELFDYAFHDELPAGNPLGLEDLPYYNAPRGMPERMETIVDNPKVTRRVNKAIEKGISDVPGTVLNWYNTEPLRERFNDLYTNTTMSPDEAFLQYMQAVGATSPQSPVPANIANASEIYQLLQQGRTIPRDPKKLGQHFQTPGGLTRTIVSRKKFGQEEGYDPAEAPKTEYFGRSLAGDTSRPVIDSHASRLLGMSSEDPRMLTGSARYYDPQSGTYGSYSPKDMLESGEASMKDALSEPTWWRARPTKAEYKFMAQPFEKAAKKFDIDPGQAQAAAWYGAADMTGVKTPPLTFNEMFEQRLRTNAEAKGKSPEQLLKDVINGRDTLFSNSDEAAIPGTVIAAERSKNMTPFYGEDVGPKGRIAPETMEHFSDVKSGLPGAPTSEGRFNQNVGALLQDGVADKQTWAYYKKQILSRGGKLAPDMKAADKQWKPTDVVSKEELARFLDDRAPVMKVERYSGEEMGPEPYHVLDEQYLEDGQIERTYESDGGEQYVVTFDKDAGNLSVQGPDGKYLPEQWRTNGVTARNWERAAEGVIDAHIRANEGVEGAAGPSQWQDYAISGGDNYREVAVGYPDPNKAPPPGEASNQGLTRDNMVGAFEDTDHMPHANLEGWYRGQDFDGTMHLDEVQPQRYERMRDQGGADPQEAARLQREYDKALEFYDSDFMEATSLAGSVRKDGQRVAFIPPSYDAAGHSAVAYALMKRMEQAQNHGYDAAGVTPEQFERIEDFHDIMSGRANRLADMQSKLRAAKEGVAPSPYTGSINDATDHIAKQALIDASRRQPDRMSWSDGDTVANLMGIQNEVSAIEVNRSTHLDTRMVRIYDPSNTRIASFDVDNNGIIVDKGNRHYGGLGDLAGKRLEDVIGKDLARKVLESDVDKASPARISGDDLKIGGEGMRGFYGETNINTGEVTPGILGERLVSQLGKLGQKNTKVEPTQKYGAPRQLKNETYPSVRLDPETMEKIRTIGLPLYLNPESALYPALSIAAERAEAYHD